MVYQGFTDWIQWDNNAMISCKGKQFKAPQTPGTFGATHLALTARLTAYRWDLYNDSDLFLGADSERSSLTSSRAWSQRQ
jgi:hypothetical protein